MKKRIVLSSLLILALIFVAACGSTGGNTNSTPAQTDTPPATTPAPAEDEAPDEVELRVTWWGGQERHDLTLAMIDLFEETYPHIKVTAEPSGFDGYFDRLTTQFAAGNAPDVIQYGGNLNDFVFRDVVLALDPYVGNQLDLSLHDQSMIDAASFDGKFYGVTLGTNAWGVLLNKTLFDQAGVPLPSETWDWAEFSATAAQLTESLDGTAGTEYFENDGFGIFIDQRGKLLHEDGVLGFEKEDIRAWFQLWQDIRAEGGVVRPEIQAVSSSNPEQSMIVAGEVAMQLIASNQYGAYSNSTTDEFVFHIHPYGDGGRNGVALRPSQFMAGNADTDHPEEVALFLDFMVNDLGATAILGNDRGAPVNSQVRQNLIDNASEIDSIIFSYIDWVSRTSDAPYVENFPGYNETEAVFKETSEMLAFNQATVDEAADEYWTEMTRILSRYTD